jgi:hypothetical protein
VLRSFEGLPLLARASGGANDEQAELFDPTAGAFIPAGSMAASRGNPAASILPSGRVLLIGGAGYRNVDGINYYVPSVTFGALGNGCGLVPDGRSARPHGAGWALGLAISSLLVARRKRRAR